MVRIATSIWADPAWTELSSDAQLVGLACMTLGATGPCTTPRLTRRTGWPTDLVERVRDEIATSAYAHILVGQRKRRRLPRELTRRVFDRDGYRCVFCASARRLQVDHIHPVVHGGSDDFDNLQTLCAPCNRRKGASLA